MRVPHLLLSFLWLSLLCIASSGNAQQNITVQDATGSSLPGVNLSINNIAVDASDENGQITLGDLKEGDLLLFTYLGYKDLLIPFTKSAFPTKITLEVENELIEEVLIYGRTNTLEKDIAFKVESISSKEVAALQSQTSADVLAKSGSVYVQKSQMGGGSPVLRGFEANKILLVVDGVRMNNAIYRSGHLQNAITIGPQSLNRMEVIYGPGSLLYGSDALGGVIHFRTKNPLLDSESHSGSVLLRYGTANKEKTTGLNLSFSNKENLASFTSISFTDFDDLRIGNNGSSAYPDWGKRIEYVDTENNDEVVTNENPNIQVGTGYSQIDLLQKIVYQPAEEIDLTFNIQFSRSSNIPRYDFLNEYRNGSLRYAEWFYGPQQRFLASTQLSIGRKNILFDSALWTNAFQKIDEDRVSRDLGVLDRLHQEEKLNIYSSNLDLKRGLNANQSLEYGVSFHLNKLESTAFREDIISNVSFNDILTRYPSGDNSLSQFGAYLLHRWDFFGDKLKWNAGVRFSQQSVAFSYLTNDPFTWPQYYYNGIDNSNNAFTWMSGLSYANESLSVKLLGGTAFRSPNIDDLAKIRVKTNEITVPNPELNPERTKNIELNILYDKRTFRVGGSVFYSAINDLIQRNNFQLPDGTTTFLSGQDSLIVTANTNALKADIYGFAFEVLYRPINTISIEGNINYTKGTSENDEGIISPLDHIPPIFGKVELTYEKNKLQTKLLSIFNGNKPIELYGGSADNIEYATIDGTPSWYTINAYGSYAIKSNFKVNLAVENILDVHYRPFASGVSGAGRNFIVSLNYQW